MKISRIELKDIVLIFLGLFIGAIFLPIGNAISQSVINILNSSSDAFSNFYYSSISINDPNLLNHFIGFLILFFLILFFSGGIRYTTEGITDVHNNLSKIRIYIKNNDAINGNGSNNIEAFERIFRYLFIKILLTIEYFKVSRIIGLLGSFLLIVVFMFGQSVNVENLSFSNKINRYSPYIENQKILELKSDWAQMETKADYNKIIEELQVIKVQIDKIPLKGKLGPTTNTDGTGAK